MLSRCKCKRENEDKIKKKKKRKLFQTYPSSSRPLVSGSTSLSAPWLLLRGPKPTKTGCAKRCAGVKVVKEKKWSHSLATRSATLCSLTGCTHGTGRRLNWNQPRLLFAAWSVRDRRCVHWYPQRVGEISTLASKAE